MIATTTVVEPVVETASRIAGLDVATVVIAVVVLLVWALQRGTLALGRELADMRAQRDWWRDVAVRALDLGERALTSSSDQ